MPNPDQCNSLLEKYRGMFTNLHLDMEYLKHHQIAKPKRKRETPFGFFGTHLLKPMFGTMDEEDALDISERINQLIHNTNLQNHFIDDNLSIIKNTIRVTNATIEGFKDTVEKLRRYLNNVTKNINDLNDEMRQNIDFKYLSVTLNLLIIEHQRNIQVIKQTLKNTLHGEFTELISYAQLLRDLQDVAIYLDETSTILHIEDLKQLQEIINIQGTIIDQRLLVEITLPIFKKEQYKMYHVEILPIRYENRTTILNAESKSYLVNNISRTYIPLSKEDLKACKLTYVKTLLCFPRAETYLENGKSCESNLLFEESGTNELFESCGLKSMPDINFIQPLTENSYYLYIVKTLKVRENCPRKTSNFTTLNMTGILEMNPHCEIIVNGMNIYSKNMFKREKVHTAKSPYFFQKIFLKNIQFRSDEHKKLPPITLKYINSADEFGKLTGQIDEETNKVRAIKEINKMENNITRTSIIMLIGIVIVLIVVNCILRKCC